MLLLTVTLLLLAGRCFYLQFLKNEHYSSISSQQQQKHINQTPQRGTILDSKGRILAASEKIKNIFAEPRIIKQPKIVSNKLQPILNMGADKICKLITESANPGYIKLKVNAEPEQCLAAAKILGIGIETDWKRRYPAGRLTAHAVGFSSIDNRGLEGVELQYNNELAGSAGQTTFLADPARRPLRVKQYSRRTKDGVGIILTIDTAIQQFVRTELMKQWQDFQAESATAIVIRPKTGKILAMVSLPDFDPNKASTAKPDNLRNRAITDQFEPGSIIKPIVAAIAVDSGILNRNKKIFCENGCYRGKGFGKIREYANHRYKNLTVREILIKSSNIGMAKIGQKLGKKELYKGLQLFGFGKKTGIDLPGEIAGLLRPTNKWTGYSITRIPYGQEIAATCLQMARAFCILANGGHAVRPFVVKAIVEPSGKVVKIKRTPPPIGFIIKPEVAKWIVQDALVGVVNEKKNGGTGWRAKLDKWQVFGKTGTANIAASNRRGYSSDDYVASFVAGAPAENPQIVVLVSIRKPNKRLGKGYTGGAVASPVVGRIIEKVLTYFENR